MTMLSIIVAATRNNAIGRGGDMLFHISGDLKYFKATTMGKPIIMGRKTFESFPNGALPGRRNIVITRNRSYSAPGIETVASLDEAIAAAADAPEVMIVGGGEIYRQAFPKAHRLYLTLIDEEVTDADTFLDGYKPEEWDLVSASEPMTDNKSNINYRSLTFERKNG